MDWRSKCNILSQLALSIHILAADDTTAKKTTLERAAAAKEKRIATEFGGETELWDDC